MYEKDPLYLLLRKGCTDEELENLLGSGFIFDQKISYIDSLTFWPNSFPPSSYRYKQRVKKTISQTMILYDYGLKINGHIDSVAYCGVIQYSRMYGNHFIKILLKLSVDDPSEYLVRATELCMYSSSMNTIRLLIDYGADVNFYRYSFESALRCAAIKIGSEKCLQILLDSTKTFILKDYLKIIAVSASTYYEDDTDYSNHNEASTSNTVKMLIEADF